MKRSFHPLLVVTHRVFLGAGLVRDQIDSLLQTGVDVTFLTAATGLSTVVVDAYQGFVLRPPARGSRSWQSVYGMLQLF